MKFKLTALPVFLALFVSGFAMAQNQGGPEKSDPLTFIKIAINVAGNAAHQNVDGLLAIYISSDKWAAGQMDSDLGPFLKLKEAKPGRSAVLILSTAKDTAIAVYFDGGTAFGMTAVKANSSGKIEAGDIAAGYKAVTAEMLKETGEEFKFESVPINTDDGDSLAAYLIARK